MALTPLSPQEHRVPDRAKIRLGFGLVKSSGRVAPIQATRDLILALEGLAKRQAVVVQGLEPQLSDADLAELLKVDQRTIRRMVKKGWLDYIDIGDGAKELRRYPVSWVRRFLESRAHRSGADSLPLSS